MAQAGVPVLYVSTFLTSFILVRSTFISSKVHLCWCTKLGVVARQVPSDRYDEAIKTWKRRDFKLVDHLEALTLINDEAVA